ncbi:SMP-30/gluconolactonase/LRE family protein [Phyllobacterium salinisoli]|uniref:SMP-30/gluconolactonase/LRE family protein n=1 Tax=Phyllobacterium salinisoli TaxID=1899321 RepID=A0A368K7A1_9HYPH|nr:SMP-30/gluconolactonase/LRE family protein [Phyllobacterium salinisoli]RCS25084.1 SMP-30/gluconolactonase/LRE family protein [Phyllobacterium salinisoli]
MTATNATVFSDIVCELGEGPGYDPLTNTVWWFDIMAGKLIEKNWPDGETRVQELGMMASALAVIDAQSQLLWTENGLFIRDRASGRLTLHKAIEADNPATRSNDARVHPSGAFWLGTMGRRAEEGAGSIWWYREGQVRQIFSGITITNSICFSPDGRVAYFSDTDQNILWRVDTDPETGLPTGERSVFHHRVEDGGMDGSVVDANGILWNACWGGKSVNAYSPDGRLIRSVPVPARQPSCPAFVGPDADRLLVTTAWQGMSQSDRDADPNAGRALLLDIAVQGILDAPVRL